MSCILTNVVSGSLGQTAISLGRAFGPALGGTIWSWSLGNGLSAPLDFHALVNNPTWAWRPCDDADIFLLHRLVLVRACSCYHSGSKFRWSILTEHHDSSLDTLYCKSGVSVDRTSISALAPVRLSGFIFFFLARCCLSRFVLKDHNIQKLDGVETPLLLHHIPPSFRPPKLGCVDSESAFYS